ncbi:hypothetical protein GCM10007175_21430 [Pseudarthrobacter scleromae]|uniref:Uncharacterized protein n=2 Tax=Pseudarthrobacter scleromae TaxID=158897 RepID=A0ABQ2CEL6_9MICC|nr:hypothetical protein GCM10007175_21430 [Pseudarthrobacter scleromae]
MAMKRPHLIPIWDERIGDVIGAGSSKDQRMNWHRLLTDATGLPERLAEINRLSDVEQSLSELRVMDVILWCYGKGHGRGVSRGAGRKRTRVHPGKLGTRFFYPGLIAVMVAVFLWLARNVLLEALPFFGARHRH